MAMSAGDKFWFCIVSYHYLFLYFISRQHKQPRHLALHSAEPPPAWRRCRRGARLRLEVLNLKNCGLILEAHGIRMTIEAVRAMLGKLRSLSHHSKVFLNVSDIFPIVKFSNRLRDPAPAMSSPSVTVRPHGSSIVLPSFSCNPSTRFGGSTLLH